jgi:PAS domain S-box-containing protein
MHTEETSQPNRATNEASASARGSSAHSPNPQAFPKPQDLDGNHGSSHIPYLDAVKAAIIITDSAGTITYWNSFSQQLYGWAANEVIGSNVMEITVSAQSQPEAKKQMEQLGLVHSWSGEFQVRCKNGQFLPAIVTLSPLFDEFGALIGIIGVSQDLRGRKLAEEQLRNAQARLEDQVRERTTELELSNASLRSLTGLLIRAQDDERRRIARELHDSTGQALAALSMTIDHMEMDSSLANLNRFQECRELIASATAEIRNLSRLMHPPLIDDLGLTAALTEYVQGFEMRGLTVEVEISSEVGRLDRDREIALFRIIEESLSNIHRHSGSTVASIKIFCLGEEVVLEIRDQGRGLRIDGGSPTTLGVGIRGMQERLRLFGGTLSIESAATGTTVRAALPRHSSPSGLSSN